MTLLSQPSDPAISKPAVAAFRSRYFETFGLKRGIQDDIEQVCRRCSAAGIGQNGQHRYAYCKTAHCVRIFAKVAKFGESVSNA